MGAGAGIVITNNAIGKINDNPNDRIAIGKSLIIIIIMSMFSIALLLKKKTVKYFYKPPKTPSFIEKLFIGWGHIITIHPYIYKYVIESFFIVIIIYLGFTIVTFYING